VCEQFRYFQRVELCAKIWNLARPMRQDYPGKVRCNKLCLSVSSTIL